MSESLTPNIFDWHAAEIAKQEAIQRVGDNASTWWMDQALNAIRQCANSMQEFTTDDVWRFVPESVGLERRAMGAAMTKAKKAKLIKPTGKYVPSAMVTCHRRDKRVWVKA